LYKNQRDKSSLNYDLDHGFKYQPTLIYIGNTVSGFKVPNMILTLKISANTKVDIANIADIVDIKGRY